MSPGPLEEGGKVVTGFIDIFKTQPLSLALVAMNLALLGYFFYLTHVLAENKQAEFQSLLASQKEVQQLLFNCTPTRPNG